MTGAAQQVRVAAPLKDSHNLQSIRLLAAGRQQPLLMMVTLISFIYIRALRAARDGDAVGEPERPQNHGVCPRKRGGARKSLVMGNF